MFEYAIVFLALFLGGLIQSLSGFGSMLVAMPMLTLAFGGVHFAAPLMSMLAMPITIYIFHQNRADIDWPEVARIVLGSLAGIPLGLWALDNVDPALIMRGVGGFIIFYAIYALAIEPRLVQRPTTHNTNTPLSLLVGLCAGMLGGAFNTNGPPLILYGDWLRWPKERFKAILQGVFLTNGILILGGHVIAGNMKLAMLPYILVALPAIALGLGCGHRLDRYISPQHFRYGVLAMLVVLGLSLAAR